MFTPVSRLRQRAGFIVFVPAFCAWVAARELSKYSSFAVMPAIPPKLVQTGVIAICSIQSM